MKVGKKNSISKERKQPGTAYSGRAGARGTGDGQERGGQPSKIECNLDDVDEKMR